MLYAHTCFSVPFLETCSKGILSGLLVRISLEPALPVVSHGIAFRRTIFRSSLFKRGAKGRGL